MVCILTPHLIAAVDPIHLEVPPTARPLRRALRCVFKQTTDHVVTPRRSVDQVREQAAQVPVPDLQIRRALRADVSLSVPLDDWPIVDSVLTSFSCSFVGSGAIPPGYVTIVWRFAALSFTYSSIPIQVRGRPDHSLRVSR